MWGKKKKIEERQQKVPLAEKTTAASYSAASLGGAGGFPPRGSFPLAGARPLPPAQPQGGWKGRASGKPLLLPPSRLLGAGFWGGGGGQGGRDEQSLNELLGQVSERNRSLLAGGGEGRVGNLGEIQNKATAPMK